MGLTGVSIDRRKSVPGHFGPWRRFAIGDLIAALPLKAEMISSALQPVMPV